MKIVHHSNYIRWMEEARSDYMANIGYSYVRLESEGVVCPVVSVSCDYKVSCRFGDIVEIKTVLAEYTGVRFTLDYEVYRAEDGMLCATGRSQHCLVDDNGVPVSIKRKFPGLHKLFKKLGGVQELEFIPAEESEEDILRSDEVIAGLSGEGKKVRPVFFESVDSTNTVLSRIAEAGAENLTAVVSGKQTAGRGRMGRKFYSPDGTGVYLSVLIIPENTEDLMVYTPMAAVAVCRAIGMENTEIKWVNDVLLNGKKVCGILAETVECKDGRLGVIVGIGVNVYKPADGFDAEIADRAGAVYDKKHRGLLSNIAARILNEMANIFAADKKEILDEYRRKSIMSGKNVTVCKADGEKDARAVCIDDDFGLVVEYDDKSRETLSSGEVTIRGIY